MSFKKIIIPGVFIVTAIILAIWGYTVFKDRNSNVADTKVQQEKSSPAKNENDNAIDSTNENSTPREDENEVIIPEVAPLVDIKREDCLDGCKRFSKGKELVYCQQFCGLNKVQSEVSDCNVLSGLEKDYCFKEQAIKQQDFKICEKIADKGIRRSCSDRLTDDLLDKQFQNSTKLPE